MRTIHKAIQLSLFLLLSVGLIGHAGQAAPKTYVLSVNLAGNGSGSIVSQPAGIDCRATCNAAFKPNTTVTLTAAADADSVFQGWSGACSGTAATCSITLKQAETVTATFVLIQHSLNITKTGSGAGSVASTPAGIDCGASCSADFDINTQVQLTATPDSSAQFLGWSGACTGSGNTCVLTMSQDQLVGVDFAPITKTLTVTRTGSGTGSIASTPAGIACGTTCSAEFVLNTSVTLTATPAPGVTFTSWAGACNDSNPTCSVTLDQSRSISANFTAPSVSHFEYDANGNLTQTTDPLGRVNRYQHDSLDRVIVALQPHPSEIGSVQGQIDYQYDSLSHLTAVTDPRQLGTTYQTDALGNRIQQTSPDSGLTQNSYDDAGNLTGRIDARGRAASYQYDSLNRLTQISYDDHVVGYQWDNCANGTGRLCGSSHSGGLGVQHQYGYDLHGNLTQYTQIVGSVSLATAHTYNSLDQRISSTTPGGQTVTFQWNGDRLAGLLVNGQTLLTQIGYEPDGAVNGWLWGNGQAQDRFYDLAGQIVSATLGVDPQTLLPDQREYGYDAAGRLQAVSVDSSPSDSQSHSYDELDHLTLSQRGDAGQNSVGYAYDDNGNRSEQTVNAATSLYAIDPASNRITNQSGTPSAVYSYDATGNLTGDGSRTYGYDSAGRRISATGGGLTTTYGYDAHGLRVSKTGPNGTTYFVYDPQGHLTGEYGGQGQAIREIVWLGNLPVAVLIPTAPGQADVYYIHTDPLGTPRQITRAQDNQPVWRWESDPFGTTLPDQNPAGLGNFVFNLRFPGQYYDAETGLHYNVFRDYDPKIGRYIQSDPIGLAGGMNTYTYVGNNPLSYIDPLGLDRIYAVGQRLVTFPDGQMTPAESAIVQAGFPEANGPMAFLNGAERAIGTALGFCPTGSGAKTALDTASRVSALKNMIPAAQKGRITMGVGVAKDANGAQKILIGTSEPRGYLRPGVTLNSGETLVSGTGHAEADIVNYANQNGLNLLEIGATRPICPACAEAINNSGAQAVTPLKRP